MESKVKVAKILVFCLLVFIRRLSAADLCSDEPAAEGSPHTIVKHVDQLTGTLTWSFQQFGDDAILTECSLTDNYPCVSKTSSHLYSSAMKRVNGKYEVTLTIHNVTRVRDQTKFKWMDGATLINKCDLQVYSFLWEPVCNDVQMFNSVNTISWTCAVIKVYPDTSCHFLYKKGNESYQAVPRQAIGSHLYMSGDRTRELYYTSTCSMDLPIFGLTPDSYLFKVVIKMESHAFQFKTDLRKTVISKEFKPELPKTKITECPSDDDGNLGYIKVGTTRTCLCSLKDSWNPSGVAEWKDSNGQLTGQDVGNGVTSLSLRYNPDDPTPAFTCTDTGTPITYRPKFAYGPSTISILVNEDINLFRKCDSVTTFHMHCDVAVTASNPKPVVMALASDDSTVTKVREDQVSGFYRYYYTVTPKAGGILTMTCAASNSIFLDIKTSANRTITVQEPPLSAPDLIVEGGQSTVNGIVTTTSGQTVDVKCRVEGGYPSVDKVTTTCDGKKNVAKGMEGSHALEIVKDMNGKKCFCEAEHVTGCSKRKSEITLNVQYNPTMTLYRVESESKRLEVSAGDTVTFVCEAEGNPRPSVTVKGQRSNNEVTFQDIPSGVYEIKSTGTKSMGCLDTDVYTCVADNGVGVGGVNKSLAVFVKCASEFPAGHDQNIPSFSPTNSSQLELRIPIIGYPEPFRYALYNVEGKEKSATNRRRRAVSGCRVVQYDYSVTYLSGHPPEGTVILHMFGLTGVDSGQYVLTIGNGIGDALEYRFHIVSSVPTPLFENQENDDDGDCLIFGRPIYVTIGITLGFSLIVGVVAYIIGLKAGKRKRHLISKQQRTGKQESGSEERSQTQIKPTFPPCREAVVTNACDRSIITAVLESQRRRNRSSPYSVPEPNGFGGVPVSTGGYANETMDGSDVYEDMRDMDTSCESGYQVL